MCKLARQLSFPVWLCLFVTLSIVPAPFMLAQDTNDADVDDVAVFGDDADTDTSLKPESASPSTPRHENNPEVSAFAEREAPEQLPAVTDGDTAPTASSPAAATKRPRRAKARSGDGLPTLNSYTKTAMAVYQGDKIDLRVEARGSGLRYRWVREDKTVCATKNCRLDTRSWGLGKHLLVLVVYNDAGSRSVKYTIYILAPSPDMQPRTLVPELIEPSEQPGAVKEDELFVQSLAGSGYTYTKQNVQIIGRQRRPLLWDEKVRTTATGVLVAAKVNQEEHFVLPSTLVLLNKSDTNRRLISLQYGALRSRLLRNHESLWSTLVGNWLQVDASSQSDIIVAKPGMEAKDPVEIVVLRGFARVIVQPPSDDPAKVIAAREVVVPAGTSVRVTPTGDISNPLFPDSKIMGAYVRRSTPHYLPVKPKMKALEYAYQGWVLEQADRSAGDDQLLTQVDKYLAEHDPVAALELLLPSLDKARGSYDLALRFGRAYQALHLHKEALRFYRSAIAAKPRDYTAHYQIGRMYLEAQHWSRAFTWLDRAENYAGGDVQLQPLHYYRGVAQFWLGRSHGARSDFNYAIWSDSDAEIAESARLFLNKLENNKWWGAYARIGVVSDDNALRLASGAAAPAGMEKSGLAYLGGFGLFVKLFSNDTANIQVGFDLEKLGFLSSKLSDVSWLDESLYVDTKLALGGSASQPFVELGLKPYLQLIFVGEDRAADIFGMELTTKFKGVFWQPAISLHTRLHQDPLPGRDDILDPLTKEPVLASERSLQQSIITLGVTPIDAYPHKLGLDLAQEKVSYRNQHIKGDNFTTLLLATKYTYFLSPRSILLPSLSYGIRDYGDSMDSRKDNRLDLLTDWRWYYSAALYQDVWLSYFKQDSSRSTSTYSRIELGLSATWEL